MSWNFKYVFSTVLFLIFAFSTSGNSQSGLPKYWEKCVVMIEKELQNTDGTIDTVPHGTGFIFFDSTLGTFLVTNRHILKGRDLVFTRYNKSNFDSKEDTVRYHRERYYLIGKDLKPLWIGHPDSTIDVAALKISLPNVKIDVRILGYSRFKDFDSLEVGEDIYFFGFPLGVVGSKGKGDFPILRSGVVSYKSLELTYVGDATVDSAEFLIDGFSFGGNSGSPVLTRVTSGRKSALVGIVKGHVPLNYRSIIEKAGPDTVSFEQNTGLAIAICADRIRETLEQFRIRKLLEKK